VSSEPSSPGFVDANARLLASVIPPAPPTLRARMGRFIATRRSGDLSGVVRWSRSREGRACFLAALAGVGLTLALYRSESSSAASAGPALSPRQEPAPVTRAIGASVHSEPLAITPTATNIPTAAAAREAAAEMPSGAVGAMNDDAVNDDAVNDDADDAVDDTAPATALADASEPSDSVRSAPRKAARAKSKARAKAKRRAKHSRKAKRQSATRGGRAKRQRATAAGPLAAWLATQHSKEAASSKHR
jgi:hypothetical protein